jgi:hypothetical protein
MTSVSERRSRSVSPSSARQARIELISEGVVASYIHDISARTGPRASAAITRRHGNGEHRRAARLGHARAALRAHEARPREHVGARPGA